jgi:hypothetical protein
MEDEWVSQEALEAMVTARPTPGGVGISSSELNAYTQKIFEEAAPQAAMQIVSLSHSAGAEKLRLDASKYIVDRAIGRVGEQKTSPEENAWDKIFKEAVTDMEEHANHGVGGSHM